MATKHPTSSKSLKAKKTTRRAAKPADAMADVTATLRQVNEKLDPIVKLAEKAASTSCPVARIAEEQSRLIEATDMEPLKPDYERLIDARMDANQCSARPEGPPSVPGRNAPAVRVPRWRRWRPHDGRGRAGGDHQGQAHALPGQEPAVHRSQACAGRPQAQSGERAAGASAVAP